MRFLTPDEVENEFHDDPEVAEAIQRWFSDYKLYGPTEASNRILTDRLEGLVAIIASREVSTEFDEDENYEHA